MIFKYQIRNLFLMFTLLLSFSLENINAAEKKVSSSKSKKKESKVKVDVKKEDKTADSDSLNDINLDFSKLEQWKSLRYMYEKKGGPAPNGMIYTTTWVFSTTITKNEICFEDHIELFSEDPEEIDSKQILKITCKKDAFLTPEKLTYSHVEVEEDLEMASYAASIKGEEMIIEEDDEDADIITTKLKWDKNSILTNALFRIVTLLPKTKGKKYSINYFSTMNLKRGSKKTAIECLGPEKWEKLNCTKFKYQSLKNTVFLLVDDKGALRQVKDQNGAFRLTLLLDEKEAAVEKKDTEEIK